MSLWSCEHAISLLPAMLVMAAFSLLLGRLLANRSRRARMIPIQAVTVILLLLEVGFVLLCRWLITLVPGKRKAVA